MLPTLAETVRSTVTYDRKRLEESRKTKRALLAMPPELTALPGDVTFYYEGYTNQMQIRMFGGESTLRALKTLGFQGFEVKGHSFEDRCHATGGEAVINGIKITATVVEVDTPPKCHIEPYQEEVTRFRMICEDQTEDGAVA